MSNEQFLPINDAYEAKMEEKPMKTQEKVKKRHRHSKIIPVDIKQIKHIRSRYRGRKKNKPNPQDTLREKFWPRGQRQLTVKEWIHVIFALTGILLCIFMMQKTAVDSFVLVIEILIFISGGTALITHPVAVYNQTKLTLMDTFRQVLNGLRLEANELTSQNDKLQKSIEHLETNTNRMKGLEQDLSDIAHKQGIEQNELLELIQENKRINRELRSALQSAALQRIMGTIMDCDVNKDFVLEGSEIDRLIIAIQHVEEVEIDVEEFRQLIIDNGGSLAVVFDMMKEWFIEEDAVEALLEDDESENRKSLSSIKVVSSDKFLERRRSDLAL